MKETNVKTKFKKFIRVDRIDIAQSLLELISETEVNKKTEIEYIRKYRNYLSFLLMDLSPYKQEYGDVEAGFQNTEYFGGTYPGKVIVYKKMFDGDALHLATMEYPKNETEFKNLILNGLPNLFDEVTYTYKSGKLSINIDGDTIKEDTNKDLMHENMIAKILKIYINDCENKNNIRY